MKTLKSFEQATSDAIESMQNGAMFVGDLPHDVAWDLAACLEKEFEVICKIQNDTDSQGNYDQSIYCIHIEKIHNDMELHNATIELCENEKENLRIADAINSERIKNDIAFALQKLGFDFAEAYEAINCLIKSKEFWS